VESSKIKRALKVVSLSVALLTVGIGASDSQLLRLFVKSQKHAAIGCAETTGG
jgi:hypothetical protein